ncbi:hypothetical protein L596_023197 [Steinernema carpocapsae]|uniref:CHK kinase-like domain-containing protein n=1 Tax=Steinernema carpocapsae TaxID=34508 RepID=A0A4U5MCX1_STECR|nr:hypothetical protein L596_023197 [Steinernema carpocapsae]
MSAKAYVGSSHYTHEWLVLTLAEQSEEFQDLRENSEVQQVDVKEISGKNGFCSKIYLCTVHFTDGHNFEAILKVPDTGDMAAILKDTDQEHKLIDEECMALMHQRECRFFTEFASKVNFPIPKVFECVSWTSLKDPGAILMESLHGNFALVDLVDGFNKQQLFSIAKDVARFQAYFLKHKDNSWIDRCKRSMHPTVQALYVNLIDNLRKSDYETFGRAVEKILPYVKDPDFIQHCFYSANEAHHLPAVFVHGDMWVNNILWKKNPDDSASNQVAAYVDWQLSHSGCLTTDLASVLVICTDAHIRRQYTDEVLQVYYDTLKAETGNLEFNLQHLKKLYMDNFAAQVFTLMICIGHLPALIDHLPVKVQEAQMEKFKVRVKLAVEDLLEIGFPKQFHKK